jgi:uncharacterized membrane protein
MTALAVGLAIAALVVFVSLVLPVLTFLRASRHSRRLDDLERKVDALTAALATARAPDLIGSVTSHAVTSPLMAGDEHPSTRALPPTPFPPTAPQATAATSDPLATRPDARSAPGLSLESRIGSRWLLYVGIAALLLGTSYFIRFAIDNEWVGPGTRVTLGVMAGLGLVEGGRRLASRGLGFYGQVVSGGGFAIVYLSIYAAYNLYALVGASTAFALMVANSALAGALANRQRSQALALAAVIGGFATPFLASTGQDAQVALFTYVALVVAATVFLARRRRWLWLDLASFALTWLTLAAWAAAYYTPAKWIPTQIFLTLFAAMFLHVLRESSRALAAESLTARLIVLVLASGPVLFHAASLANLAGEPAALLVYLIAITVVGIIAADAFRWHWTRLLLWVAVVVPFLAWVDAYPGRAWLAVGIVGAVAIYALHAMSQLRLLGRGDGPRLPDLLLIHGNGLWLYFALVALLTPVSLVWTERLAWMLAVWNLAVAARMRRVTFELALHYVALGATLAAIGVAMTFDGPWVTVGWAVEGTALLAIGLRVPREWIRLAGGVLLAMAAVRLGFELLGPARAGALVLFNARAIGALSVIGLLYLAAIAHRRWSAGGPAAHPHAVAALVVAANVLTLLLVTAEVTAACRMQQWQSASHAGDAAAGLEFARQAALSAAWAAYGLVLVAVGIRWRYAPVRYLAIAILAVVIGKVFLIDLARLDRLYRVLSVIALGLVLLAASYLYQRFADEPGAREDQATPLA